MSISSARAVRWRRIETVNLVLIYYLWRELYVGSFSLACLPRSARTKLLIKRLKRRGQRYRLAFDTAPLTEVSFVIRNRNSGKYTHALLILSEETIVYLPGILKLRALHTRIRFVFPSF